MLTATETQRVKNLSQRMNWDAETALSMNSLFDITKDGCTIFANDLFIAAYTGERLPDAVVGAFFQYGLVNKDGTIPPAIRQAIREAIEGNYLKIHSKNDPTLRPDPFDLVYH